MGSCRHIPIPIKRQSNIDAGRIRPKVSGDQKTRRTLTKGNLYSSTFPGILVLDLNKRTDRRIGRVPDLNCLGAFRNSHWLDIAQYADGTLEDIARRAQVLRRRGAVIGIEAVQLRGIAEGGAKRILLAHGVVADVDRLALVAVRAQPLEGQRIHPIRSRHLVVLVDRRVRAAEGVRTQDAHRRRGPPGDVVAADHLDGPRVRIDPHQLPRIAGVAG